MRFAPTGSAEGSIATRMNHSRRSILVHAGALSASLALASMPAFGKPQQKFRFSFAPHPHLFAGAAGDDYFDQLRFAADQGFTAWEDNGLRRQSPQMQERIGAMLRTLGMRMGVFVAYGELERPTLATGDPAAVAAFLDDLRDSINVAQRVGVKWLTVVPGGRDPRLPQGIQTANIIDALRCGVELMEPHGLILVLEPLNRLVDHPHVFLDRTDLGYALCRAVDSPACKLLYDIYHQQLTAGAIIPTMDATWPEIAYLQVADVPGRRYPGTGEINYAAILAHIRKRGGDFIIGMEHHPFRVGGDRAESLAIVAAYRALETAALAIA
jgi:hydroxypyruvate isomerase